MLGVTRTRRARAAAVAVMMVALFAVSFLVCAPRLSLAADSYQDAAAVERAKELIAALPADPDAITETDRAAIEAATAAYDALSANDQSALDSEVLDKEQSYGRWLESAQWGLAAKTETLDDSTDLVDGDYSAYITSTSSMGKSTSERARSWTAVSLVAKDGKLTAVIRCNGRSAFKNLRLAGADYAATFDDGVPEFAVPMQVNENLKFTADASSIADSIAYEIEVRLDVSNASSSEVEHAKELASAALSGVSAKWTAASQKNVRAAADALAEVAGREGAKRVELELFQDQLAAAQKAVKKKASAAGGGKKSSGSKGSGGSASSGGSGASGSASSGAGSSGASGSSASAGSTGSSRASAGTGSSSGASSATAASGRKAARAGASAGQKAKKRASATAIEVGSGASGSSASGAESSGSGSAASDWSPSYPLLLGLLFALLLVLGMVVRSVSFNRQMGLRRGGGGDVAR